MQTNKEEQSYQSIVQSKILLKEYQFRNMIGKGCFGKIFKVYSKRRNQQVALKIEEKRLSNDYFLKNQYQKLQIIQGIQGIPEVYSFGQYEKGYFMQMQLLQKDISDKRTYDMSQITHLTIDLLTILEQIHTKNIIHQDIKPQNIMLSSQNKYYLIDFGLSKIQNKNDTYKILKSFIGTPRYASIAAHQKKSQTKVDDLESLFYNLAYLYYKKLPWSNIIIQNNSKLQKIKITKTYAKQKLFVQMGDTFYKAFKYIQNLQRYQKPNYKLLIGYFKRHKSVIQKPINIHEMTRRQNKKYSLNASNFLQVPQNPFASKKKLKDLNNRQAQKINYNTCSANSDFINYNLLYPKQIIESQVSQNIDIDQSVKCVASKIKEAQCNFYMKNPFQCHA